MGVGEEVRPYRLDQEGEDAAEVVDVADREEELGVLAEVVEEANYAQSSSIETKAKLQQQMNLLQANPHYKTKQLAAHDFSFSDNLDKSKRQHKQC